MVMNTLRHTPLICWQREVRLTRTFCIVQNKRVKNIRDLLRPSCQLKLGSGRIPTRSLLNSVEDNNNPTTNRARQQRPTAGLSVKKLTVSDRKVMFA